MFLFFGGEIEISPCVRLTSGLNVLIKAARGHSEGGRFANTGSDIGDTPPADSQGQKSS